jgi:hypothetical protein
MDVPLDDVLRLWGLYRFPDILADDELFDALLMFVHRLLTEAVRKEREATTRRLLQSSRS